MDNYTFVPEPEWIRWQRQNLREMAKAADVLWRVAQEGKLACDRGRKFYGVREIAAALRTMPFSDYELVTIRWAFDMGERATSRVMGWDRRGQSQERLLVRRSIEPKNAKAQALGLRVLLGGPPEE